MFSFFNNKLGQQTSSTPLSTTTITMDTSRTTIPTTIPMASSYGGSGSGGLLSTPSATAPTMMLYNRFLQYPIQYVQQQQQQQQQQQHRPQVPPYIYSNNHKEFAIERIIVNITILVEHIVSIWNRIIQPNDIFLYIILGFGTVPLLGILYSNYYYHNSNGKGFVQYNHSILYYIADVISQASRIAIIVYVVDCFIQVLVGLGLDSDTLNLNNVSKAIAKVLYIAWVSQHIVSLKRCLLTTIMELVCRNINNNNNNTSSTIHNPSRITIAGTVTTGLGSGGKRISRRVRFGQIAIVDRLLNGIIYICTAVLILEVLDVEMGLTIKSMFAVGSIGTVVFGLASRDLAAMFVNGLSLSITNLMQEGDDVKFGDGTIGVVDKIGWFQTAIRHYDDLVEIIPNSELGMQRVKNISRINTCRIQQVLRFHYNDALVLPKVLIDIIEEIKISCPEVITDNSRPLRAVWTDYCETYLKVVVTAHFMIKPIGKKYCNNRQQCLLAIHRAVQRNNIQFVTTVSLPNVTGIGSTTGNKKGSSKGSSSEQADLGSCR